jgi:hypothetical protein
VNNRIGPRFCTCCGERESDSGCVRGLVCRCEGNRYCAICGKCQDHCKCEKPELYRDQMEAGAVRIAKKLGCIEAEAENKKLRNENEQLRSMLDSLNKLAAMSRQATEETMLQLRMQVEAAREDYLGLCRRREAEIREDIQTLKTQRDEIQRLRTALQFYAVHYNGNPEYDDATATICNDHGETARKALGK